MSRKDRVLFVKKENKFTNFFSVFRKIIKFRALIWSMAVRDFKNQYIRSYLGILWALIQPLVFFGVLLFVFTAGLRSGGNSDGFPFVVYLITGLSSWFFISGSLNSGANVIRVYKFLVRNSGFELSILAIVKILSNLFLHSFFIIIVFVFTIKNDITISIHCLQLAYYIFSACVLLIGASWLTSSVSVFVPDVNRAIPLIVQIGFWGTPIFWNINNFSPRIQYFLKFNPAYYIVNGYRESIMYKQWFWDSPQLTIYYWIITLFFFFGGLVVFKKLQPHFAEVI